MPGASSGQRGVLRAGLERQRQDCVRPCGQVLQDVDRVEGEAKRNAVPFLRGIRPHAGCADPGSRIP
jgi:hypothetical protein